MTEDGKAEFLKWLLRPTKSGHPFVTYRGAGMEAEVNFQIPFEDISTFFGVDQVTIRGQVWERNSDRTTNK
jgi:hypothetical protein